MSKKELKQEIMYDESHRFIIGKKPCARDGQSVTLNKDSMYIFGGDRHLMAFNDLYCFDLDKGLKSVELYKSNWNDSIFNKSIVKLWDLINFLIKDIRYKYISISMIAKEN